MCEMVIWSVRNYSENCRLFARRRRQSLHARPNARSCVALASIEVELKGPAGGLETCARHVGVGYAIYKSMWRIMLVLVCMYCWAMACSMIAVGLAGLGPAWPFGKCVSCLALRLSRPLARGAHNAPGDEAAMRSRGEESVDIPRATKVIF